MFGTPGNGVHRFRLGGMAIVDLGLTIFLSYFMALHYSKPVLHVFLIIFLIGQLMHYLFCVDTAFLKFLKV
jgi:hypothetical protein